MDEDHSAEHIRNIDAALNVLYPTDSKTKQNKIVDSYRKVFLHKMYIHFVMKSKFTIQSYTYPP